MEGQRQGWYSKPMSSLPMVALVAMGERVAVEVDDPAKMADRTPRSARCAGEQDNYERRRPLVLYRGDSFRACATEREYCAAFS